MVVPQHSTPTRRVEVPRAPHSGRAEPGDRSPLLPRVAVQAGEFVGVERSQHARREQPLDQALQAGALPSRLDAHPAGVTGPGAAMKVVALPRSG